ncbi:signal peptidase I [Candidatus Woesearchaeota archaeon]|nr:signal peptidase I [Candidatus Woesearchaeota archaeon]
MDKEQIILFLKKLWHFIWNDNSIWSWLLNIVLAFVLIKFVVFPGLGWLLDTSHPLVAVVSESMEHDAGFDAWWGQQGPLFAQFGISRQQFLAFDYPSGFNKGDIMILRGAGPGNIAVGDVIVFTDGISEPFIHRVVNVSFGNGFVYRTKGDHNPVSIVDYRNVLGERVPKGTPGALRLLDETDIRQEQVIGKAVFRIPFFGYLKVWAVELLRLFTLG